MTTETELTYDLGLGAALAKLIDERRITFARDCVTHAEAMATCQESQMSMRKARLALNHDPDLRPEERMPEQRAVYAAWAEIDVAGREDVLRFGIR